MAKADWIRIWVWTEQFLGTRARGESLPSLLETFDDGRWIPDRWGNCEPTRNRYYADCRNSISASLAEQRGDTVSNILIFRKRRPRSLICVRSWRSIVPSLNYVSMDLEARAFSGEDGAD